MSSKCKKKKRERERDLNYNTTTVISGKHDTHGYLQSLRGNLETVLSANQPAAEQS